MVPEFAVLNWMFPPAYPASAPHKQSTATYRCCIALARFFGAWSALPSSLIGATYRILVYQAFLIGAILPIPLWLYGRNRRD